MEKKVYTLKSITLTDSNFKRNAQINFEANDLINKIDIELEENIEDEILGIGLSLTVTGNIGDDEQYRFFTRYIGVFEIGDVTELPVERFAKTNGPAIIFPFIREQIASISLKAGINPVLLPPMNFTKLTQEKPSN